MDNFIPLEAIHIASPCSADWNAMQGDDRARFCGTCQKNVYNLSDMTRTQAQALVAEKEGNLCVQFYRRADGTVLTDDCPVPLRPARNGARWVWRAIGAGLAAIAAFCGSWVVRGAEAKPGQARTAQQRKAGRIAVKKQPTPARPAIRGDMQILPSKGKPSSAKPVAVVPQDRMQSVVLGEAAVVPNCAIPLPVMKGSPAPLMQREMTREIGGPGIGPATPAPATTPVPEPTILPPAVSTPAPTATPQPPDGAYGEMEMGDVAVDSAAAH